jgi:hypothetical protein
MWGALIFLMLFLVIDPTTRDVILGAIEEARLRIAVEAPWPYFLLVIVSLSATVSALIMKWWPRTADKSKRVQVMHRYHGRAASDLPKTPEAPALLQLVAETASLMVPVRARAACGKLMRNLGGFTGLKRLPGA